MMTLQQALGWLPSARLVGDGRVKFLRVHTDTRSLQPGDLFVALKGDRFDAHEFLPQAKAQGAVAAIAQQGLADAGLAGLEVGDPRLALGQLAAGWRSQFSLPLIAVTGSNGKTTVTQMIAEIFRAWKSAEAFATEGNLNNDIGVPLTLLRLRASHQVGVVELGMNHPGEIAYLAALVKPTIALVNNAQREHLEFMTTVEAVARENGSVLQSLDADGVAVFPADDDYSSVWRRLAGSRRVLTLCTVYPGRRHCRGMLDRRPLAGSGSHAVRSARVFLAYRRPAQRQKRFGRSRLRARCGCALVIHFGRLVSVYAGQGTIARRIPGASRPAGSHADVD